MNTLLAVMKLLPVILGAIMSIEVAIGAGQGQTKKQIVMLAIEAAAAAGEKSDNKLVAAISALVDQLVGALNAAGLFAKAAA